MNIAVDNDNNVLACGRFMGTVSFGNINLDEQPGGVNGDVFILKLDNFGNVLWAKTARGLLEDQAQSISIDQGNNIIITGWFYSPQIIFDNDTVVNYIGD